MQIECFNNGLGFFRAGVVGFNIRLIIFFQVFTEGQGFFFCGFFLFIFRLDFTT